MAGLTFPVGQFRFGNPKFFEGVFHRLQIENVHEAINRRDVSAALAERQIIGRNGRNGRVKQNSAVFTVQNVKRRTGSKRDVVSAGREPLNEPPFGFRVGEPFGFARFRLECLNGSIIGHRKDGIAVKNHGVQMFRRFRVRVEIRLRDPLAIQPVTVCISLRDDVTLPNPLRPGDGSGAQSSSENREKEQKRGKITSTIYK